MKKKIGFTLIELLVVIAIIALLMSILMPALARVRRTAKAVICMANLRQWSAGLSMYADQYDGYNPYGDWAHSWWHLMLPYVPERKLFLCPMAPKTSGEGGKQPSVAWNYGDAPKSLGAGRYIGSYGVNPWIFSFIGPSGSRFGGSSGRGFNPEENRWKRCEVKGADIVPVFGDCSETGAPGREKDIPPRYIDSGSGDRDGIGCWCLYRHECNINMVFMDWNVRSVGLKELWMLKWHRRFDNITSGPVEGSLYPAGWPDWMRNCKRFKGKGK